MTRCKMGECVWSLIIKKHILKEHQSGKLFEVTGVEGITFDDSEFPVKHEINFIEWYEEIYKFHVFCSAKLPTIIFELSNLVVFDFRKIPGVSVLAANLYTIACHNEPPFSWYEEEFLEKYKYRKPILEEIIIESPFDIFKYF